MIANHLAFFCGKIVAGNLALIIAKKAMAIWHSFIAK
jgi:hypothetical protein